MNTEITDNNARPTGWVFYDGDCSLCTGWVSRFGGVLRNAGFTLATLQENQNWPQVAGGPKANAAALTEMIVVTPEGCTFGGADAIVEIARRVWWAWPLWVISRLPGAMRILRAGYRVLAANRHCINGACLITHRWKHLDWLPLIILPAAAIVARAVMPDWVFMWVLALAIFFGCKWLTLRRACVGRPRPHRPTALAYLFLWPGMDAEIFLTAGSAKFPSLQNWVGAVLKTLAGVVMLWFATSETIRIHSLLTGWLGMFGIVLLLHFGLFHLLALLWQTTGRNVKPVMRAPLLATSLADFWGNRWNTAFNALAHDLTFRPLVRRIGVGWAIFGVFLISGVVHDLVISLPARGGYGLPTAYFLVQGVAVLFERSRAGRALGLGRGGRGWLFMLVATATPVFWLFHPTFIHNIILPMLQTIGAT